jgi:hypothetical protein
LYVHRHYQAVREQLKLTDAESLDVNWQSYNRIHNHVILLVKNVDRRLVRALRYARSLKADSIEGLFVDIDGAEAERVKKLWDAAGFGIKLTIIESPFREIIQPIRDYVRSIPKPTRDHVVEFAMRSTTGSSPHWCGSMASSCCLIR